MIISGYEMSGNDDYYPYFFFLKNPTTWTMIGGLFHALNIVNATSTKLEGDDLSLMSQLLPLSFRMLRRLMQSTEKFKIQIGKSKTCPSAPVQDQAVICSSVSKQLAIQFAQDMSFFINFKQVFFKLQYLNTTNNDNTSERENLDSVYPRSEFSNNLNSKDFFQSYVNRKVDFLWSALSETSFEQKISLAATSFSPIDGMFKFILDFYNAVEAEDEVEGLGVEQE